MIEDEPILSDRGWSARPVERITMRLTNPKRRTGGNSLAWQAELKLRALPPRLREIIDKHTLWSEGYRGSKARHFNLDVVIAIANECWKEKFE